MPSITVLLCYAVSIVLYPVNWFISLCAVQRRKLLFNDTILVTGAGRGIGRELALALCAEAPKQILLMGRDVKGLQETAELVGRRGMTCGVIQCDVSDRDLIYTKVREAEERFGRISILVNNAGVVHGQDVVQCDCEQVEDAMQVNLMAHVWLTKCLLPGMLEHGGHIVNINSVLGLMGLPGATEYCASKHAAAGFSEALHAELWSKGCDKVYITNVHPFLVNTTMFSGCQTRFPWLFPALDVEYVARKTVDALTTNTQVLIMPRLMHLVLVCKSILPVDAMLAIQKFFGVDVVMQNFHGRHAQTVVMDGHQEQLLWETSGHRS